MREDWDVLLTFFPSDWEELAACTGALKGLRKDKSAENLLRTLLLHVGCGHSMRETVVRAKLAGLADLSDVAFLKRLRKSKEWLRSLCVSLCRERGMSVGGDDGFSARLFDATTVKEPGKTGSLWRIHYSVTIPSLTCDFFRLTESKGKGTGESFFQYPIRRGDYIIADRGYSTAAGIHRVESKQARVMVRVNTGSLPLFTPRKKPLLLLDKVTAITRAGVVRSWPALVVSRGGDGVRGRVCALRKTEEAARVSIEKIRREARKKGQTIEAATLEFAKFVIVFTTFEQELFSDFEIMEWYRSRWQVELIFKKLKSIAQLGHIPKHDDDSAKAWLYGKMFVALVTQKLVDHASTFSPWGYELEESPTSERLARVQLRVQSGQSRHRAASFSGGDGDQLG